MTDERRKIVVIAGPSGSGKNSVLQGVLDACPNCVRLVTAATRAPRVNEKHGVDHYFLSKEDFLKGIDEGTIPEHWHAVETDRYYGTYIPDLEKKLSERKTVIAELQIEGMKFFREKYSALSIFIVPGSMEELRRRILSRQDISATELDERLKEAEKEIKDHSPLYDYVIVNERDKLNKAINSVVDILRKEKYL